MDLLPKLPAPQAMLALVALGLVACGDPPDEQNNNANNELNDFTLPGNNDGGPKWTSSVVEGGGVGLHVRLAARGDRLGVAYYTTDGIPDGRCEELGDEAPERVRWPLHYARRSGEADWSIEEVSREAYVGSPPGLDLAFAADGTPTIAAMVGDPLPTLMFCGANDLALLQRQGEGDWTAETVVTTSSDAATGEAASDYGEVVGFWPALAYGPSEQIAMVYKDVHAGGLQSDDVRRADFEMALSDGGGWQHIPVDWGRGAGDYNDVLFDEDGNLYLITYNGRMRSGESITGIWVRRSTDGGQTFEEVQLTNRAAPEGPDAVIDDEGRLHIIYYEADRGFPRLATLSDASNFESVSEGWTLGDIGDSQYDEGYRPSIAVGPSGHVAVAYYRCNRAAAGLGDCDPNEDGLVFAWEDEGEWTQEVVDAGDLGLCGESPSLGFDDAGRAVVAYRCEIETDEGTFDHVKFARRKALP